MSDAPPFSTPAAWVTCPECAAQVPCYDPATSRYFGCFQCRTYFRAVPEAGGSAHRISAFTASVAAGTSLRVGSVGELGGYRCRITGCQVRGEKQDRSAQWREYQLRPTEPLGNAEPTDFPLQLAEYQGHWLLVRRAPRLPKTPGTKPFREKSWRDPTTEREYQLWHRYQPIIRDAQGEFDWDVREDEKLAIQEFTAAPYLLVSEYKSGERPAWYLAEHLEPAQIAAAFALAPRELPDQVGTGAAQPNAHQPAAAWRLFGVATLLLLALSWWLAAVRPSAESTEFFSIPAVPTAAETAAAAATTSPSTGYSKMLVSKTIVLTNPAALDIEFIVPGLTNHWLEITASLVNEQTGRGYEFTRSLEYYEGVEDSESWSEGRRSATATLSGLPPGRYHFNLYPSPEAGVSEMTLQFGVAQHTQFFSNFFLIVLLLSILPLWQWVRHGAFESSRWENSDFGPSTS